MRIICVLFFAFCASLFAKSYSDKVVPLFINQTDTTAAGRLLPTNSFEVLKEEGDKVLLKITGYVNPSAPFVLYYNDTQRIMVAAFSKTTKLDFKDYVKSASGAWDKASIEVWAKKANFVNDNKEMMQRAKTLFSENCGICHALHPEKEFGANQWPAQFRSMVDRTGIDKNDHWLVIEYLQKNSKDFKRRDK